MAKTHLSGNFRHVSDQNGDHVINGQRYSIEYDSLCGSEALTLGPNRTNTDCKNCQKIEAKNRKKWGT